MQQLQKWMESILSQNSGVNFARSGELSVWETYLQQLT